MRKVSFFFNTVRRLSVFIAAIVIISLLSSCSTDQVDVNEQINSRVKNIQQSMDIPISGEINSDSSLYDDVMNNEDFEGIVALGVAALPELMQLLDQSEQEVFVEYIYAIALEQISKVDLRKEKDWDSGKEFLKKYAVYLKEVPNKVKRIADESISDSKKIDQLKALGTPAIPYLFELIDSGYQELSPAFDYLTDNKSKGDIRKWGIENIDQLNLLINLVEQQSHLNSSIYSQYNSKYI